MNRRKLATTAITAIMAIGLSGFAEKQKAPKKQTKCPVMGGKINKAQYTDVKGKRIYVCCPGCIPKINAAPDKYIKQLEAEGITLDKPQAVCPVMGGKINKAQYIDVKGKRIYVCCPGCIPKIEAAPDKYIMQVEAKGIALDSTPKKKTGTEQNR